MIIKHRGSGVLLCLLTDSQPKIEYFCCFWRKNARFLMSGLLEIARNAVDLRKLVGHERCPCGIFSVLGF